MDNMVKWIAIFCVICRISSTEVPEGISRIQLYDKDMIFPSTSPRQDVFYMLNNDTIDARNLCKDNTENIRMDGHNLTRLYVINGSATTDKLESITMPGTYRCWSTNNNGKSISKTFTVINVTVSENKILDVSKYDTNKYIRLECGIKGVKRYEDIQWSYNRTEDATVHVHADLLGVLYITWQKMGNYTCSVDKFVHVTSVVYTSNTTYGSPGHTFTTSASTIYTHTDALSTKSTNTTSVPIAVQGYSNTKGTNVYSIPTYKNTDAIFTTLPTPNTVPTSTITLPSYPDILVVHETTISTTTDAETMSTNPPVQTYSSAVPSYQSELPDNESTIATNLNAIPAFTRRTITPTLTMPKTEGTNTMAAAPITTTHHKPIFNTKPLTFTNIAPIVTTPTSPQHNPVYTTLTQTYKTAAPLDTTSTYTKATLTPEYNTPTSTNPTLTPAHITHASVYTNASATNRTKRSTHNNRLMVQENITQTSTNITLTPLDATGTNMTTTPTNAMATRSNTNATYTNTIPTSAMPPPTTTMPTNTNTIPSNTNTIPAYQNTIPSHTSATPSSATAMPIYTNTIPSNTNTIPAYLNTIPSHTSATPSPATAMPIYTNTIPSNTNTIPAYPNTIPSHTSAIPSPATTMPTYTNTIPLNTNTIPAYPNTIPSHTTAIPSPATTMPTNTNTIPAYPSTIPSHTSAIPTPTTTMPTYTNTQPSTKGPRTQQTTTFVVEKQRQEAKIKATMGRIYGVVGGNVTLECVRLWKENKTKIDWRFSKNTAYIKSNDKYHFQEPDQWRLTIGNLTRNDMNNYTCLIDDRHDPQSEARIELIILDQFQFKMNSTTKYFESEEILFVNYHTCLTNQENTTTIWYVNGHKSDTAMFGGNHSEGAIIGGNHFEGESGCVQCEVKTTNRSLLHQTCYLKLKNLLIFRKPPLVQKVSNLKDLDFNVIASTKPLMDIDVEWDSRLIDVMQSSAQNKTLFKQDIPAIKFELYPPATLLPLKKLLQAYHGNFSCNVSTGYGEKYVITTHVIFSNPDNHDTSLSFITPTITGVTVLTLCIVICIVKRKSGWLKKKIYERRLMRMAAKEFDEIGLSIRNQMKSRYVSVPKSNEGFPRQRLRILEVLGEGNFGKVVKAEALDINGNGVWETVAIKMCKETATDSQKEDFAHELALVKQIPKHTNVVNYLGYCQSADQPTLMILEYVSGGNLLQFLRKRRPNTKLGEDALEPLDSSDLSSFAYQIAKGIEHLSKHNIIHRDIAARNILITENNVCKVADLGLARDLHDSGAYEIASKGVLPIRWMAPESLTDGVYTSKSDVWSFGILLWEIVTLGASPYPGMSARQVMSAVVGGDKLECPDFCSKDLQSLIMQCWGNNPNQRPSFSEICHILELLLEEQTDYLNLQNYEEGLYAALFPTTDDDEDK